MVTDLRFGVLGSLAAWRDSAPVAVPTGRRRAILACLLVHAGHPVSADVLVDAAWGEGAGLPEDPRAALHIAVSRLRTALGAGVLVSQTTGYALTMKTEAVDAQRFESLRSQAKSAPPERAVALLREAVALWRGPAYADFADREFAAIEAARLDRARLDAAEELAASLMVIGDYEEAAATLEALLDDHPLREHALALLMTALYRAGRQTEALVRFRAHRELMREDLGLDPAPALTDLESRILGHSMPKSPPSDEDCHPPAWLDTSTAFFGRESVRADLVEQVSRNRLTTVTGIGGVGKTRLVAEALPELSVRLRVPITVVELAAAHSGRVSTAVAGALGLTPRVGAIAEDVLEYLGAARRLVVIDNCEHLRAEVADFAGAVIRRCPGVRLLATSRHRLGLPTERIIPLVPLPVPGPVAEVPELESSPAMRLLVDRMNRLRPTGDTDREADGRLRELCRQLDGLPLAIELAASRAAALGTESVLRSLTTDLAGEPMRDLRQVVDWSARLLTRDQRRLLGYLAVFADSFDAGDVADVGSRLGPWTDDGGVLGALEELVEANLLVTRGSGPDYRMLALVRAFATRRLADSGEEERARLAHAGWVRDVAAQAAQDWVSNAAARANRRLLRLSPDVNTALLWTLAAGRLDVAADIAGAVKLCLHWLPGVELAQLIIRVGQRCADAEPDPRLAVGLGAGALASAQAGDQVVTEPLAAAALARADADTPRFLAALALAVSHFYAGRHSECEVWLDRLMELRDVGPGYRVEPHSTRALVACARDDLAAARSSVSIARAGAAAAGASAARAFALYVAGEIEARGDPAAAAILFREAAAEAEWIGAAQISQLSRLALFAVLVRRGEHQDAFNLGVPLLQDIRRAGSWPQIWTTIRISAELLAVRDRREDAAFLLGAAQAAPTAPPLVGDDVGRYAGLWAELRRTLGESVVERISDLAAGLPRTQVIDRAAAVLAHERASPRS